MRIIPAIDIIGGKCVRLVQGNFNAQTTYANNPVDVAKSFEDAGLTYLHVVDLDGAQKGHVVNEKILEKISSQTRLHIDFGGGLKSFADVEKAFDAGAKQLNFGSMAVKNRTFFLQCLAKFGAERIILSADSLNGKIATNGWKNSSEESILPFVKTYCAHGVQHVTATDISKDGMLSGPAFLLYKELLANTNASVVASGGISSLADLTKLQQLGCDGAIVGKAIYEGRISLNKLAEFVQKTKPQKSDFC